MDFSFNLKVLLHRLAHFQRVWSLAPNENTGKEVTSLAWRPDGKGKQQNTSTFNAFGF